MNKKEQEEFNNKVAMLLDDMLLYLYSNDYSIERRQGPLDNMAKQLAQLKGLLQP